MRSGPVPASRAASGPGAPRPRRGRRPRRGGPRPSPGSRRRGRRAAPCLAYSNTSWGPRTPDSATRTTSSGIRGASRAKVSRSTSRVLRLRALTPISVAPAAERPVDLLLVVHLDERGEPDGDGPVEQRLELVLVERGDDQQRQVGAGGAGLPQLVGGDDEVLAQHRDVDGGAHGDEVGEAAAEAALLGEHADRRGTTGCVVGGQRGRVGDRGQRALAGAGPLDLGDHADTRTRGTPASGRARRARGGRRP